MENSTEFLAHTFSSSTLFRQMVQEIKDYAILFLDTNGQVVNWNQGAVEIKGYAESEIIGKHFSVFYTEEDVTSGLPEKLLKDARINGRAFQEGWRKRKDGSVFWAHVVITAIHNENGMHIGYTKVTRDLTSKKNAEESLREQALLINRQNQELLNINKELQDFAYMVSHDLKAPLRKINIFSEQLLEEESERLSDSGKDYFKRIRNAISKMKVLIDDMLRYAQTNDTSLEKEIISSNRIQKVVLSDWAERPDASNAQIYFTGNVSFQAVAAQIRQVFENLISNALKFRKPDSPAVIHVSFSYTQGKEEGHIAGIRDKKYVFIKFEDNGIGFANQYNESIFDLLVRLHGKTMYEGTGIGLSICKRIIENHGGKIYAEGRPGEGAVFKMFLPMELTT